MRRKSQKLLVILAVFCLLFSSMAPVGASTSQRVLLTSPHKDAAFVDTMPGFETLQAKSFVRNYGLTDGLVIRQSRIEDGKVIIPPSGMYVTSRAPRVKALQGDQMNVMGKLYYVADYTVKMDVIKDVELVRGQSVPFGDGTKVLELSSISVDGNGFVAPEATFQILKSNGAYYGAPYKVSTDPKYLDITKGVLSKGTSKITGTYLPGEKGQNWQVEFYGTPVAINAQSYLVADQITDKGGKVKEFVTSAMDTVLLTPNAPREILLGEGERYHLTSDWVVKVEKIENNNAATVKLWNMVTNETVIKKLGPINAEMAKYVPADQINRQKLLVRPKGKEIQVELDLFRGAFKDGKVALNGYYDIFEIGNPSVWPGDSRFIVRPDI